MTTALGTISTSVTRMEYEIKVLEKRIANDTKSVIALENMVFQIMSYCYNYSFNKIIGSFLYRS